MRINNIEISNYSAELIDRQVSTQNIDSITNWYAGTNEGNLLRQQNDFKSILLTFLVTETTEDAAYKKISALTEELRKCQIKFDDINLLFSCYLDGSVTPVRVQNSVFKVTYLLKNDWAIGDSVTLDFPLTTAQVKKIDIRYAINWGSTINHYTDCFDLETEMLETIANETVYINKTAIAGAASEALDWTSLFLLLGVDVNKHKPSRGNTLYGFPWITTTFDRQTAASVIENLDSVSILYNRFSIDGEPDIPNAYYPSTVWTTGETNNYYFDLGVGNGIDYQNLSVVIQGRFFQVKSNGNGPMFSAGQYFRSNFTAPNDVVYLNDLNPRQFKVTQSSTSGSHVSITTLENIADFPMRTYGFKSSNRGAAATKGYADIIFNGSTEDRVPVEEGTSTANVTICYDGNSNAGTYVEYSRVQVYDGDTLIRDCIPIAGNVKNCFLNTYDVGMYDVNTMEYIPWKNVSGTEGSKPSQYMPIPIGSYPTPPAPLVITYSVVVNSGSGSGEYAEGDTVTVIANAAPTGYVWDKWTIVSGGITLADATASTTSFVMPANAVELTATYVQALPEPDLLYYKHESDITDETVMGQNAKTWSVDGPYAFDIFYVAYSQPNVSPTNSQRYNSNYFKVNRWFIDKWGRRCCEYEVTTGKSKTGQYIIWDMNNGTSIRKDFNIKG